MAFILTKNNENTAYGLIEGYVETADEVANVTTGHKAGSKITVIETGDEYVLTLDKHWVLVPKY